MKRSLLLLCPIFLILPTLKAQVVDDIVNRNLQQEKQVIPYQVLQEGDILWQKEIWREIDVREKMNLHFNYPEAPLFDILISGIQAGQINAYNYIFDEFSEVLSPEELDDLLVTRDTLYANCFMEDQIQFVETYLTHEDIDRYRIKEIWYLNNKTSQIEVRILGIAPLQQVYDDNGNYMFELPLFWVYYPQSRQILSTHNAFIAGNDAVSFSWEQVFESRYFSSTIYKTSNIQDLRLKDIYMGTDRLLEADRLHNAIFDLEGALWSY